MRRNMVMSRIGWTVPDNLRKISQNVQGFIPDSWNVLRYLGCLDTFETSCTTGQVSRMSRMS